MTKREQLAQIVADTQGLDWHVSHEFRQRCLRAVDAILAELREPDEKMHAAGEQATRDKKGNETGVVPIETEISFDVWQAMIDAIE